MADLKYGYDMPRPWIPRTFEPVLTAPAAQLALFPVWLLLGPRQVGKSALLKRCSATNRQLVDLDDLNVRARANDDPELFIRELEPPFAIDEIQYAPALLSPVKRIADSHLDDAGIIWLTGSQNFKVMEGVKETLAGRVALLNLLGLSEEERLQRATAPQDVFATLIKTTFPRLADVVDLPVRETYLASYVQTYIERDVRELMRVEKRREFEIFLKMCALRTGQILNLDDLGRVVGVSAVTIKGWLSVLEDSFLIQLVRPFFDNRNRRLTKSPKIHFLDAGLAAYLAGWREPEQARLGPMGGALFETHILGQIIRYFRHRAREFEVHFWRTRDGQEVDFLVEALGRITPLEVKMGSPRTNELFDLEKIRKPNWGDGVVVSLMADPNATNPQPLNRQWRVIHPTMLPQLLGDVY